MTAELIALLTETTLATSAAVLLVLLARRPLRAAFGAGVAYGAWGLVPAALVAVLLPAAAVPVVALQEIGVVAAGAAEPLAVMPAFDARPWLIAAWAAGAIAVALMFAWQQHRFVRGLGRLARRADGCLQADSIAGLPAAIGLLRPRIVLPADYAVRYSDEQQALLAAHERLHVARGDLQFNALVALLRCLFWFNPLLHLAARRFRHDQELACDARVIGRHPHARRAYGEAMFNTQLAGQPLPLGCHWGNTHPLKERIDMLRKPAPSRSRWIAGSALVLGFAIATGYAAWAAQPASVVASADTIPAGHVRALVSLRIDDADAQKPVDIVVPAGQPIRVATVEGGHEWRLTAAIRPLDDRRLDVKAVVTRDGAQVAAPRLMVESGKPAALGVGEQRDGRFRGFRVELVATAGKRAVLVDAPVAKEVAAAADTLQAFGTPGTDGPKDYTPAPRYPAAALEQRISGKMVLLIDVAADGRVTRAVVEESEPAGVFDAEALEMTKQWWLKPKVVDGRPVADQRRVPIMFHAPRAPRKNGG